MLRSKILGNYVTVQELVQNRNLNIPYNGETALHLAAKLGNL